MFEREELQKHPTTEEDQTDGAREEIGNGKMIELVIMIFGKEAIMI
jgi:hypothetical protein